MPVKPKEDKPAEKKKRCFIAMPISTPKDLADKLYGGDDNHFHHVLECLFIPAVEQAGFVAVKPSASGSELIHANIARELHEADMVLCDVSILNPNVLFEYGVRASFNKPVTLVRDEVTTLPFDTHDVHCEIYSHHLRGYEIDIQRNIISKHIIESEMKCKGENPLWSMMSLGIQVASFSKTEGGKNPEMSYLIKMMENISGRISDIELKSDTRISPSPLNPPLLKIDEQERHGLSFISDISQKVGQKNISRALLHLYNIADASDSDAIQIANGHPKFTEVFKELECLTKNGHVSIGGMSALSHVAIIRPNTLELIFGDDVARTVGFIKSRLGPFDQPTLDASLFQTKLKPPTIPPMPA